MRRDTSTATVPALPPSAEALERARRWLEALLRDGEPASGAPPLAARDEVIVDK